MIISLYLHQLTRSLNLSQPLSLSLSLSTLFSIFLYLSPSLSLSFPFSLFYYMFIPFFFLVLSSYLPPPPSLTYCRAALAPLSIYNRLAIFHLYISFNPFYSPKVRLSSSVLCFITYSTLSEFLVHTAVSECYILIISVLLTLKVRV